MYRCFLWFLTVATGVMVAQTANKALGLERIASLAFLTTQPSSDAPSDAPTEKPAGAEQDASRVRRRPERVPPTAAPLERVDVTTNPDGTLNRTDSVVGSKSGEEVKPREQDSSLERAKVSPHSPNTDKTAPTSTDKNDRGKLTSILGISVVMILALLGVLLFVRRGRGAAGTSQKKSQD